MVKGQRTKAVAKAKRDGNARAATKRVWKHIYLEDWRTSRGLSIEALAAKADVSPGLISLIENKKSAGSPESLEKLAKALDISLGELFEPPPGADQVAVRAWIPKGAEDRFAKLLELMDGKPLTKM